MQRGGGKDTLYRIIATIPVLASWFNDVQKSGANPELAAELVNLEMVD